MVALIVGIEEIAFEFDRADAVVPTTPRADIVAASRLAILDKPPIAACLVGLEIGLDAVLGAGLAMTGKSRLPLYRLKSL